MASNVKQDMPPKGGYGPIEWTKVVKKPKFSGYTIFAAVTSVSIGCMYLHLLHRKKLRQLEIEMQDSRVALQPMVVAERQRMQLRQFRKNRDEENEVMKNVEGWETGTYYGEPVYHNLVDRFPVVNYHEYYIHNNWNDMWDRMFARRRH